MPKKNTFEIALKSAEKELARAIKQREVKQKELAQLNAEIPSLQQTIQALRFQLGKKPTKLEPPTAPIPNSIDMSGIPPEIAKYVLPQDLTGMGSIPANSGPTIPDRELTEDELLELGDVK